MTVWSVELRVLSVFYVLSAYVMTAGVIYGWVGFQRSLKREGQFLSECNTATITSNGDCPAQDQALNTIAIVAFNLASAATVVHGLTLDAYGPRINAVVGGMLYTVGMALLAVSDSSSLNAFIAAYSLIGWGGIATYLPLFQFAHLFDRPNLARSLVNALFTTSALTFTILDWIMQAGVSRHTLLALYATVAALFTIGYACLYPDKPYHTGDTVVLPITQWWRGRQRHLGTLTAADAAISSTHSHSNSNNKDFMALLNPSASSSSSYSLMSDTTHSSTSTISAARATTSPSTEKTPRFLPKDDEIPNAIDDLPLEEFPGRNGSERTEAETAVDVEAGVAAVDPVRSLKAELLDPQTWLLALYFAVGLLFSNWFVTTIGNQLSAMGDSGGYAIAFIFLSALLPIPFALLISWGFKRFKYSGSVLLSVLFLCGSYLPLYIHVLPLQLLGFLAYAYSRAIIVTVTFNYPATQYRHDHYGRLVAAITLLSVPIGFLQLAMQHLHDAAFNHDYTAINTFLIFAFIPFLAYARWLRRKNL